MKSHILALGLLSLGLAACSAEIKGDGGGANPFSVQDSTVQGPALDGFWSSRCLESRFGPNSGRRIVTLKIAGNTFEHEEKSYRDNSCTNLTATDATKGTFVFKKQLDGGAYIVEYRIPVNANAWSVRLQQVKLEKDVLQTSDLTLDDQEVLTAPLKVEMLKTEAPSQAPVTVPAPSKLLRSGSYAPAAGGTEYCGHSISTMASGGVLQMVYLTFDYPCNGTVNLTCQDGRCTNSRSRYEILVQTETSYQLRDVVDNETIGFIKK